MPGFDHARLERRAVNLDAGGRPIVCSWDECDRDGTVLYRHTSCLHSPQVGCEKAEQFAAMHGVASNHLIYVFCSQRHRNYFVNATGRNAQESVARTGRAYGNLPAGLRKMIG